MNSPSATQSDEHRPHDAHSSCDSPSFDQDYGIQSQNSTISGSASSASLRHLRDALSPMGFDQLLRMQTIDFCHVDHKYLEEEFSDAIREMERVESFTGALFRAFLEIKRTQTTHNDRVVRVEQEISQVRAEIQELMRPLRASYVSAEAELRQEKKGIESLKAQYADRMDTIETSLHKAELNVTVLRSQWATNRKDLDQLGEQLLPTQELAHSLAARLLDMEQWEEGVWSMLKDLREDVYELRQPDVTDLGDSDEPNSLAAEFAAGTAPTYTMPTAPTRSNDGWYYNECEQGSDSSMPSTDIFGESSDEVRTPGKETLDGSDGSNGPEEETVGLYNETGGYYDETRGSDDEFTDHAAHADGEPRGGEFDCESVPGVVVSSLTTGSPPPASLRRPSERDSSPTELPADATATRSSDDVGSNCARVPAGLNWRAFIRFNLGDNRLLRVGEGIYDGIVYLHAIHPTLPYVSPVVLLGVIRVLVHLLPRWSLDVDVPPPSPPSEHPVWEWALQRTSS
ncbi:hypothetical protein C8T65DRAFT_736263 [Cerioporus squamosus]|nr:hypothetical protein C8T65DRAFT_736263 [Cerioporus squamosus]